MSKRRSLFRTLNDLAWWGTAGALVYWVALRPRHTRWGASLDETRLRLPGDELLPAGRIDATHAVTVNAPPEKIWPWIAQIGQGRGGFYSYTWIENWMGLKMRNADRILPEYQNPRPGERIPLAPDGFGIPIAIVEPGQALVLHGDTRTETEPLPGMQPGDFFHALWGFYLLPGEDGATRLVERFRADWNPGPKNTLTMYALVEPGSFIMERKMLLGIKRRAEAALDLASV